MPFLPQTKKERTRLFYVILLLIYIGVEIKFSFMYGLKRDTDFRAFQWDTATFWRLKSSFNGEAFVQKIHTNSAGFRGPNETRVKKDHDLRIITFGDSRTYGFSVKNDESYSAVLEHELRKNNLDAEVINAGTHGFSSAQCRAKLEQVLKYDPDIVIVAPGYNDRRYIITRPPDTDETFRSIARLRKVMDVVQISNIMFGLLYKSGKTKLEQILKNPPSLDTVSVRVEEERFVEELDRIAEICKENQIILMYLFLQSDPGTYSFMDHMMEMEEEGKTTEVVRLIEEAGYKIPNYSYNLSRFYLGKMYEKLGEPEKAKVAYASHIPSGSLFGESVLRLERYYFNRMREAAEKHNVFFVDSKVAITASVPEEDSEEVFLKHFVDECHYTAQGHRRIGAALAHTILSFQ